MWYMHRTPSKDTATYPTTHSKLRAAFAHWHDRCESLGQYLTQDEADTLFDEGMTALRFYLAAANKAASVGKFAFLMIPKMHTYHHLLLDAKKECYNMRFFHCFAGEDFVGSIKALAVACVGTEMSRNVLRRTLLKIVTHKQWDKEHQ